MMQDSPDVDMLIDYVTGHPKPNLGAEANRQAVERYLIDTLGYTKSDIEVDVPISFDLGGEEYTSYLDLVVVTRGRRLLVIKCVAGSLDSREREVIAAARLLEKYQIPLAAASDGLTALVWDTFSGKEIGRSLGALPSKTLAEELVDQMQWIAPDATRLSRSKLVFRSYDSMNVNVQTRRQP